ncbi:MAG: acyl carrier protein [Coprothermobacterota bacterium]|nr:acyl carrier protein [Coprothermobacterota bacterium]
MNRQQIREQLQEIVKEILQEDVTVEETSRFDRDLPMDSLAMVELGMAVEGVFHIEIRGQDLDGLKTVADLISYIQEHGGK